MKLIRNLYDRVMLLAQHHRASHVLAGVSFTGSIFFPIPLELFLIPMVLSDREKAWRYAFIATISSVLGGGAAYFIGWGFYEAIAEPILEFYNKMDDFHEFQAVYSKWGWWIVFFAGFTPFPFKVITVASGLASLNFPFFMIASLLSRGARFYLLVWLLWKYGQGIRDFIEKYLGLLSVLGFILLFGIFYAMKYVF